LYYKIYEMKIQKFRPNPKFKKGDRCVYVYPVGKYQTLQVLDNNMIIDSDPFWYEYDNHPNKGYWQYSIIGKSNECPEDFLRLYTEQEEGDDI